MTSVHTETETVVKHILPYLRRRGYDPEHDIDFETAVKSLTRYTMGYVDLLVTCGKPKPLFLIEAKRSGKNLTAKDRDQAISYARSVKVLFAVVTNGNECRVYNTKTKEALLWDGRLADKIPSAAQLPGVIKHLKAHPDAADVPLAGDTTAPFRPALPLKQLNALFARCHNKIRDIEKNEENAFADFSKIMFLRLLEEKADSGGFVLPYSYRFFELAERPTGDADQVRDAVGRMLAEITKLGYGDVLAEPLHLKRPATYQYLVRQLSSISFEDSGLDTKGAAFEYFVRATLKGKRLGQYFTPRPLVDLMIGLIGRESMLAALLGGTDLKVLDPACGTGGFLVFMMKALLTQVDSHLAEKKITQKQHDEVVLKITREAFYGADANEGVCAASKMNMIVAGDGHTNITAEDSLKPSSTIWKFDVPTYDFILTNPPFGTSESSSLTAADLTMYPVKTTKGQHLFLQRMVLATLPGGYICTVIDEGVLNTVTAQPLRRWILQNTEVKAVVRLPDETFKPNKINVRSSVLLLRRREAVDVDVAENYFITFCDLVSLGYQGSGEGIRGFDFERLRREVDTLVVVPSGGARAGYNWSAFDVPATDIAADSTLRLDLKYWEPTVRHRVDAAAAGGAMSVKTINKIPTAPR